MPVIAWVGPVPAKAGGAGLLLMYAAALAAVAPGSQTGPLHPIDLGHPTANDAGLDQTIRTWLTEHDRSAELTRLDVALPAQSALDLGAAQVRALSVPDLLDAAYRGTEKAYFDAARPTATLELPSLSEHVMGQLMQMLMLATVVEGRLMGVNPYGQPGVETSRRNMQKILREK